MAAPIDRHAFKEYVARLRGAMTQRDFLDDLNSVTGWGIDHSRLSRYLRGELPVGAAVQRRFEAYAAARGLPAYAVPDVDPQRALQEQALAVAKDHVKAIREQTEVMRQLLGALTAAATTAAPAGTSPIEAVVSQVIGRSALPLPTETHAPTG